MSGRKEHYDFRRLSSDDLVLVNQWQQRPHVAEWWDAATEYTGDDIADPRLAMWLVELAGKPFAFIQDYAVHGFGTHPFAYFPPSARGIDQFIAEPAMLSLGHGPRFIKANVTRLFLDGAPEVGTDPHPENARAIKAYRKAGFRNRLRRGANRLGAVVAHGVPASQTFRPPAGIRSKITWRLISTSTSTQTCRDRLQPIPVVES